MAVTESGRAPSLLLLSPPNHRQSCASCPLKIPACATSTRSKWQTASYVSRPTHSTHTRITFQLFAVVGSSFR